MMKKECPKHFTTILKKVIKKNVVVAKKLNVWNCIANASKQWDIVLEAIAMAARISQNMSISVYKQSSK